MKCDRCDETAIVNYQKVWKKFDINKDEDYFENKEFEPLDIDEPTGDDNLHFCKEHDDMFMGRV